MAFFFRGIITSLPHFFVTLFLIFSVRAQPEKLPSPSKPLVVYIHETFYVTQKEILEKQCDFPFVLKPFSGSDLVGKILLEGGALKADVVVGLESERMEDSDLIPLTTPFPQALFQKISLPFPWKNRRFLPLSYGYLSFLYDERAFIPPTETITHFLKALAPKSLIVPDPRTSMVGQGALSWVPASDYGMLHQKTVTYPKGWSGAFALFNRGRARVMLSYTTSLLCHQKRGQPYVRCVFFEKTPHPLQVIVSFVTAKKNLHPKAFRFLEILLSKPLQASILENYAYPVTDIPLPDDYENCRPKNAFLLEGDKEKKKQNLQRWMRAGYKT